MRLIILIIAAVVLVGIGVGPTRGSDGAMSDEVDASSTGGFDKLTGTATGHFHHSFPDYIQQYDGITTANLTWEEDPDYLSNCHCRAFRPTGTIDWTWNYVVEYSGPDDTCTASDAGHLEAGVGLSRPEEQVLILFEDASDPEQYLYLINGNVPGEAFLNCDGGFTFPITDFIDVESPGNPNTATPEPLGSALPADASFPTCDSVSKIRRDATRIAGSCYVANEGIPFDPYDYTKFTWDFAIAPEPIVFIHGFLGSEIKCGGDNLWPNIPPGPRFADMSLASDGVSPAAGACNATVGELVQTVAGSSVYKTTADFLNQLHPGKVHFFNWDWRKGPQESLASLDSFIGFTRSQNDNAKVVLMAHSYGGLLARLYLDSAARVENVARVITIGTPAWGSPKALFPVYAGVETPEFSPLDLLVDNDELKEFARNLTGDYFLYPSANYGPWLTVGAHPTPPLDQQGLLNYVTSLGGNAALLGQALGLHASTLDTPYVGPAGSPPFEIVVGTGLPTISDIQILPNGRVKVGYANGDGTVPAKSAARGPLGGANPNKNHTYYSCRVDHVALPGHTQITDGIDDFLKYGEDIDGLETPCSFSGVQYRLFRLPALPAAAGVISGSGSAMSIEDAVLDGVVDYLDLPNEKFIIAGAEIPEIALPQGGFLEVSSISEDGLGPATVYGPLNGQVTISGSPDAPVVLLDGDPPPIHGDVNCDEEVTVLDALFLILHAGGTPKATPNDCAAIGSGAIPFGDLDCDDAVTADDSVGSLRMIAGVPLTFLDGCQ